VRQIKPAQLAFSVHHNIVILTYLHTYLPFRMWPHMHCKFLENFTMGSAVSQHQSMPQDIKVLCEHLHQVQLVCYAVNQQKTNSGVV